MYRIYFKKRGESDVDALRRQVKYYIASRSRGRLLAALVIAFDILVRVGYGAKRLHYDRGWHATSTLGKFGAAAGAGKLLNLDVETLANAFGIAGTTAGGLRLVFGNMGKSFHAGKAAMDGVLAAILAQKGFDCSKNIFRKSFNFSKTGSGNF